MHVTSTIRLLSECNVEFVYFIHAIQKPRFKKKTKKKRISTVIRMSLNAEGSKDVIEFASRFADVLKRMLLTAVVEFIFADNR